MHLTLIGIYKSENMKNIIWINANIVRKYKW